MSYVDAQGVGRQYAPAPVTLDVGGFVSWNIRTLRDGQTPDPAGHALPATLTTGNAHLWSSIGDLIGMDMTWSEINRWAIQCGEICTGPLPDSGNQNDNPNIGEPGCKIPNLEGPIQVQEYKRILYIPGPVKGIGDMIIQACGGPLLTHCGSLKPWAEYPGFILQQGLEVTFFDLWTPYFFWTLEICVPIHTKALLNPPC